MLIRFVVKSTPARALCGNVSTLIENGVLDSGFAHYARAGTLVTLLARDEHERFATLLGEG